MQFAGGPEQAFGAVTQTDFTKKIRDVTQASESSSECVCDSSQQVNKNRTSTSEPTMTLFVYFISTEISFKQYK